jgi:hypothetical protein
MSSMTSMRPVGTGPRLRPGEAGIRPVETRCRAGEARHRVDKIRPRLGGFGVRVVGLPSTGSKIRVRLAGIATSKSARRPELPASARPDAYVRPGRPSSSGVRLRTTSQAMRHPRGKRLPQGRGQLLNTISIHQGPAEADGRKVPGHWEGDLVLGKRPSAVLTLVERTSGSVALVALPAGWRAEQVRPALTAAMSRLPKRLRRSLTWDQGKEMAEHVRFTLIRGCWCSSATRVAPGSEPATRMPTGPCANICPGLWICAASLRPIWTASPPSSTAALDRSSASDTLTDPGGDVALIP